MMMMIGGSFWFCDLALVVVVAKENANHYCVCVIFRAGQY